MAAPAPDGRPPARYWATWRDCGSVGRRFLAGTAVYSARYAALQVAFPLFAKDRGYDSGQIGLLVAAMWLAQLVLGAPIIALGRRGRYRDLLAIGPWVSATGLLLLTLTPDRSFGLVAVGAFAAGLGGVTYWSLGDPLLVGATPPSVRAHLFALKFFTFIVATAVGGGVGGWLPAVLDRELRLGHLSALGATLGMVAVLDLVQGVVFWSLPSPPPAVRAKPAIPSDPHASADRHRRLLLVAFVLPDLGVAVGVGAIKPFLPLFLSERHGLSAASTGTVIAAATLASGCAALALPGIAAQAGSVRTITACRLPSVTAIALWFTGIGALAVAALVCAYYAFADGTEATYVTDVMSRLAPDRRTAFSGLSAMLWSAGSAVSSTVSGRLQDRVGGFGTAFAFGIVGYGFAIGWMALAFPRLPRPHPEETATSEPGSPSLMPDDVLVHGAP